MVFLDVCDDISDRMVDQVIYTTFLVTCMQRTFLPFLPLKDLVHVEVRLHLPLMFVHTPTSFLRLNCEVLALSTLGGT